MINVYFEEYIMHFHRISTDSKLKVTVMLPVPRSRQDSERILESEEAKLPEWSCCGLYGTQVPGGYLFN